MLCKSAKWKEKKGSVIVQGVSVEHWWFYIRWCRRYIETKSLRQLLRHWILEIVVFRHTCWSLLTSLLRTLEVSGQFILLWKVSRNWFWIVLIILETKSKAFL